jgi:hypothetical protein
VTTETTEQPPPTDQCGEQLTAVQVVLDVIHRHPTLPAPFITVHPPMPRLNSAARLDFQSESPFGFEGWRVALGIPPTDVRLHTSASNVWLSADIEHQGVRLHLTGFNVPLTAVHAQAPRDRSEVPA